MQYTGAAGIVSRCVADIAKRKREEEADDYELNFDELCEHACPVTVYFALLQYSDGVCLPSEPTQTTRPSWKINCKCRLCLCM